MKRAVLLFAALGGLGVPIAFTLAAWGLRKLLPGAAGALALLHDVQLPLWPMSKLILDDPAGKHWLYLPLATLLSNALIYAAAGAVSAWGRARRGVFPALLFAVVGLLAVASRGFGTTLTGFGIAALCAVAALAWHHGSAAR